MKILLFVLLSFSILFANVGKITGVKGDVTVNRDATKLKATSGFILKKGDQIITSGNSKALVLFNDNTSITVGKNSSLNVDEFVVDQTKPNTAKTEFSFNKGLFRTITGTIGKINPKGFKIKTKSASIGIRGTDFITKVTPKYTQTLVKDGAVSLTTLTGVSVDISAGMQSKADFGAAAPDTPNVATQEDIEDMGADEVSDTSDLEEEPSQESDEKAEDEKEKEEEEEKKEEDKVEEEEEKEKEQTKEDKEAQEEEQTEEEKEQNKEDKETTEKEQPVEEKEQTEEDATTGEQEQTQDNTEQEVLSTDEETATEQAPASLEGDNADTLTLDGGEQTVTADIEEANLNFAVVETNEQGETTQNEDNIENTVAPTTDIIDDIPEVATTVPDTQEATNTPPTIVVGENNTINEDTVSTLDVKGLDNDGDQLTYELVKEPQNGSLEIVDGETLQYTPSANYHGEETITLKVTDTQGESYQKEITFNVNSINDTPVLTLENTEINLDENTFSSITYSIADIEDAQSDLTFDFTSTNGTLEIVDGKLKYTPNEDYAGSDTITLTLTDKDGASVSQTITVTVNDTTYDVLGNSPTGEVNTILSTDLTNLAKEIVGSDNYMEFGYILNNATDQVKQSTYITGDITPDIVVDSYIQNSNTASYSGNVAAFVDGVASGGDITLNMDFGNRNLTGNINITQGNWKANINSGSIGSSGFNSTDITSATDSSVQNITGNLDGKYYGPDIQSVGGTFTLQSGSNSVNGVFGGSK